MKYKGYETVIRFDEDAGLFHGEVIGIKDVITFQGRSVGELRDALKESVDDYLEFCAERGENPDKPFSGQLVLRMPPELHKTITTIAKREGESLNNWITKTLEGAAARLGSKSPRLARRSRGRVRSRP